MTGLLLDTNALLWLVETKPMRAIAMVAIADAQAAGTLYVSPVTAWEIALASRKKDPPNGQISAVSTQQRGFGRRGGERMPSWS